jgi:hypothetical protein
MAIRNALLGWSEVDAIGPDFFASQAVERALYSFITSGKRLSHSARMSLSRGRARINNFYKLLSASPVFHFTAPDCHLDETKVFLSQLEEQVKIWKNGSFTNLDMSEREQQIYWRVVAKTAPVLFNMGFNDAIPHSAQVSRLAASMARHMGGRHSEILQAAIVGWLHDPKLHPAIDLSHENLATHPVNAAGLAWTVFHTQAIKRLLVGYFAGNKSALDSFIDGTVDALGINNDSRFVQMTVVLPTYVKRVSGLFGDQLASQFESVLVARLESAATGKKPRELPPHLHGVLSQIRLDSGLRGLSKIGLATSFEEAQIDASDPVAFIDAILDGTSTISNDQLFRLRLPLLHYAVLSVDVDSATLLHHHQEVVDSGQIAAKALVIADPMMLSPHKVASVYKVAFIKRLESFVASFDDNNRLMPKDARESGTRWQRAVYLSMLLAADRLCGTSSMNEFKAMHPCGSPAKDVDALRAVLLQEKTWGRFAQVEGTMESNADVKQAISALEAAYVDVVNQFRKAVYTGGVTLECFYPEA